MDCSAPGSVSVPRCARIASGGRVVHVGLAGAYKVFGPFVELLEIVRGVVQVLAPVETEPADVALDGVDEELLFLDWIGVVEPQMALAAELAGDPEVQADRFRMPEVQETVGFGRKTGDHGVYPAGVEVRLHDVADEISARFGR